MFTTPVPETLFNTATMPHTPVQATLSQESNSVVMDTSNTNTPLPIPIATQDRQHHVEVLTPCTRQYDKFFDPQGRPLQPGTMIFCEDLPFIVSANGKIYNYTGSNMETTLCS